MNQEGQRIKRAIEGLLFSATEPISLGKMRETLEPLHLCCLDELKDRKNNGV